MNWNEFWMHVNVIIAKKTYPLTHIQKWQNVQFHDLKEVIYTAKPLQTHYCYIFLGRICMYNANKITGL